MIEISSVLHAKMKIARVGNTDKQMAQSHNRILNNDLLLRRQHTSFLLAWIFLKTCTITSNYFRPHGTRYWRVWIFYLLYYLTDLLILYETVIQPRGKCITTWFSLFVVAISSGTERYKVIFYVKFFFAKWEQRLKNLSIYHTPYLSTRSEIFFPCLTTLFQDLKKCTSK